MDCFTQACQYNETGKRCERVWSEAHLRTYCEDRLNHPPKKLKVEGSKKVWNKKVVTVYYWYKDWSEVTGYKPGSEHEYSNLHEMIDHVLECGLKVMLLQHEEGVTLAIDDVKFYQR